MGCLLEEPSHPENAGQTLHRDVLDARSSSLQKLRASFLRALRVLRRRQKRKESVPRAPHLPVPMGGRGDRTGSVADAGWGKDGTGGGQGGGEGRGEGWMARCGWGEAWEEMCGNYNVFLDIASGWERGRGGRGTGMGWGGGGWGESQERARRAREEGGQCKGKCGGEGRISSLCPLLPPASTFGAP